MRNARFSAAVAQRRRSVHRARGANEDGFTNDAVGNAFKRAIKKYPNAFRRLTD